MHKQNQRERRVGRKRLRDRRIRGDVDCERGRRRAGGGAKQENFALLKRSASPVTNLSIFVLLSCYFIQLAN